MSRKAWIAIAGLCLLAGVLFAVRFKPSAPAGTPEAVTPSTSAGGGRLGWDLASAAKPFVGRTVRLIGEDYPPLQAIEKLKPDFERLTGIKIEVARYEAEAVLQKDAFDLNSGAG